jgi:hypothetical protein
LDFLVLWFSCSFGFGGAHEEAVERIKPMKRHGLDGGGAAETEWACGEAAWDEQTQRSGSRSQARSEIEQQERSKPKDQATWKKQACGETEVKEQAFGEASKPLERQVRLWRGRTKVEHQI